MQTTLPTSPINRAQGLGGEEGPGSFLLAFSPVCSLPLLASHVGKTYPNKRVGFYSSF
jgi:hypothetical protein